MTSMNTLGWNGLQIVISGVALKGLMGTKPIEFPNDEAFYNMVYAEDASAEIYLQSRGHHGGLVIVHLQPTSMAAATFAAHRTLMVPSADGQSPERDIVQYEAPHFIGPVINPESNWKLHMDNVALYRCPPVPLPGEDPFDVELVVRRFRFERASKERVTTAGNTTEIKFTLAAS